MAAARDLGYGKVAVVGGRGRQLPHPPGPGGGLPPGRLHPLPAPLKLCGDNGSMIGSQGYYEYLAGGPGRRRSERLRQPGHLPGVSRPLIRISNEILSFETRTLRVLAVLRTAPSHTKLDALRAIKTKVF